MDESNLVLQIACIKALVHYSTDPDYYLLMEEEVIERTFRDSVDLKGRHQKAVSPLANPCTLAHFSAGFENS